MERRIVAQVGLRVTALVLHALALHARAHSQALLVTVDSSLAAAGAADAAAAPWLQQEQLTQ